MRKPTEPEAHRGRVALIEGRLPEGMQARCGWCRNVSDASEGEFVAVKAPGAGASRVFRCASCSDKENHPAA